ncbi:MAG: ribonuclease D, partial [Gammaproteobacteria bacterium]
MPADPAAPGGFSFIDRPDDLRGFCASLQGAPWIAFDTEFIREKSYYPRLCLIQVAVPGRIACIDPLAIEDLTPLLELLYDRAILKVLHACSQDLEIFAHLRGEVPGPIFDTQLAAPLLGLPEQMGYGAFVKEMLGLSLDKGQARTDWSRRPLGEAQLRYAADDVRYLVDIYPEMVKKLEALGRLGWLRSEFEPYEQIERYRPDPGRAWLRIRGAERLRPKALAILQLLARWREEVAQQRDLPRNWVVKDDALVDIARLAPEDREALGQLRTLPAKTADRYGDTLLRLVREGLQREPEPGPAWKRRSRPTAQEEALADLLQARLRLMADEFKINGATIASRRELLAMAQGEEDLGVLRGWRREMAGGELRAMCRGQRSVCVKDGRL